MTLPPSTRPPCGLTRRSFLALSGLVPAALLSSSLPTRLLSGTASEGAGNRGAKPAGRRPIGLELYSVRTELARDLPGTLTAVARMGYEDVEFYAPYLEWTLPYAKDVRARLDDLGMRCLSTHNHIESFTPGEGMAKAIALNQVLGARHLIMASAPPDTSGLEGWKALGGRLSDAADALKPHGLSAGYHNHQTEWRLLDGQRRVMDVLASETPPEFVLQLDVGTCLEAGADPIAWIRANPGRIRSLHLKDWAPGRPEDEKGYRVLFGEGAAPWREIVATAESVGGVEYFLLEQEGSRFSETETARRCLEAWRRFRAET